MITNQLTVSAAIVKFEDNNNFSDELEAKITELQTQLKEIQDIIDVYSPIWLEYQAGYKEKQERLQELIMTYKELQKDTPDKDEFEDIDTTEREFQDFGDTMGFGEGGPRGSFGSSDDYFEDQYNKKKEYEDQNYVMTDIQSISGELAEALKDMPIKDIWRKLAVILHEDKLACVDDVIKHPDYRDYLKSLWNKGKNFYEKKDKAAMILALQEACIRYIDDKFILADYQTFLHNAAHIHKRRIIEGLEEQLVSIKKISVYVFYVAEKNGDATKAMKDLENEIQHIEDLITSYNTSKNNE